MCTAKLSIEYFSEIIGSTVFTNQLLQFWFSGLTIDTNNERENILEIF